jgi:Secretion system C-terminal sorting domain
LKPVGCTARINGDAEENLAESFTVYPNPTENSLNISLANFATESGDLILYNTLGQVILSENISLSAGKAAQSWDLTTLSPGMYNCIPNRKRTICAENH